MGASQFLIVAILNCFLPSIHAAVSSTGFTVSLGYVSYFLPPGSVATVSVINELKASFEDNGPFVPITVVESTEQGAQEISSIATKYLAQDDVFQLGFLEGMQGSHKHHLAQTLKHPQSYIHPTPRKPNSKHVSSHCRQHIQHRHHRRHYFRKPEAGALLP